MASINDSSIRIACPFSLHPGLNFERKKPHHFAGAKRAIRYISDLRRYMQRCSFCVLRDAGVGLNERVVTIYQLLFEDYEQTSTRVWRKKPSGWQHKTLEEILKYLEKVISFLRHLLVELTYAIRLSRLWSEYFGGMQHSCTTMPWTIWPSLVVLWGVCWMFNEPMQQPDFNFGGQDASLDGSSAPSYIYETNFAEMLAMYDPFDPFDPIQFNEQPPAHPVLDGQAPLLPVSPSNLIDHRQPPVYPVHNGQESLQLTVASANLNNPSTVVNSPLTDFSFDQGFDGSAEHYNTPVPSHPHVPPPTTVTVSPHPIQSVQAGPSVPAKTKIPCPHADCISTFTEKRSLKRHLEKTCKHDPSRQQQSFYCTHLHCPRSTPVSEGGKGPFSRRDHLKRHLNSKHPSQGVGDGPDQRSTPQRQDAANIIPWQASQDISVEPDERRASSSSSSSDHGVEWLRKEHKKRFDALAAKRRAWELEMEARENKFKEEEKRLAKLQATIGYLEKEEEGSEEGD
ncbi:hypothetical protein QBC38DRAFT_15828 [Podospora fimiseda]|uniref:Uncharacterized protein n=1 Tax=Podospora fimiseda TaxID=252190 RepID=A0AAN7BJS3_9PEZI|nr:hypothetical protein QBC38DRAFT_15828 [Podospora fimiseda]